MQGNKASRGVSRRIADEQPKSSGPSNHGMHVTLAWPSLVRLASASDRDDAWQKDGRGDASHRQHMGRRGVADLKGRCQSRARSGQGAARSRFT